MMKMTKSSREQRIGAGSKMNSNSKKKKNSENEETRYDNNEREDDKEKRRDVNEKKIDDGSTHDRDSSDTISRFTREMRRRR